MSPSSMRKLPAYNAGVLEADGGLATKSDYDHPTHLEAYDLGRREHLEYLNRESEHSSHPLRLISREAAELHERLGDSDTATLARLVERMADYLLEHEIR